MSRSTTIGRTFALLTAVLACGGPLAAQRGPQPQGRGGGQAAAPATAQATAPIDLTGTWVSIISEDWRWRMVTPARGDYQSVPINAAAQRVADAWDPVRDMAAGEQCRAYGAAGIMRMPTRLRISWLDPNTLKVETDTGTQTRLLRFGDVRPPAGEPGWQGHSVAQWETASGRGQTGGSLKVVTTRMRPGYLRRNGIPYSGSAVLTEYLDAHREPNGDQWLVVTSVVDDPTYLQQPYVTSPNFKREPDNSKWDPTPCS